MKTLKFFPKNATRRALMLMLVVAMVLGFNSAKAQTSTPPALGDGTDEHPYQIATLDNLYWLSQTSSVWNKHFKQVDDIDASATPDWDGGAGFLPIGTEAVCFLGFYDGGGYKITNLSINRLSTTGVGLFGFLGNLGRIENVSMENVVIKGANCSGSIVGHNMGTIVNSDATGSITGSYYTGGITGFNNVGTIVNCYTSCTINGAHHVGGFVGYNSGNIKESQAEGNVVGSYYVGGFVGTTELSGNISKSYAKGNVTGTCAGGFFGINRQNSVINNCYSRGNVTGNNFASGGFGGANLGILNYCYSTGKVIGYTDKGFVGAVASAPQMLHNFWDMQTSVQASSAGTGVTGKTTAEMKTQSTFTNWDFNTIWGIYAGVNDGYPSFVPNSTGTTTCITIKPNAAEGKDATIAYSLNGEYGNTNFGSDVNCDANAWTTNGTPFFVRTLIDFDLSSIPSNAIITSALLSFYYNPTSSIVSHSGLNSALLQRITSNWDENTVTWNNQPTTTTVNQILLAQSLTSTQDYTNIDITNLISYQAANPSSSFGIMLRLETEEYYRRLTFASSDNADATLHPSLTICYTVQPCPGSISIIDQSVTANNTFTIDVNTSELLESDSIISFDFRFNYDITKMQYVGYSDGTLASGVVVNASNPGEIIVGYPTTNVLVGAGSLIRFTFRALDCGTTTPTITDFNYKERPACSITNGTINIVSNSPCGNVSGAEGITAYDAALVLQYDAGLITLTQCQLSAADVNYDGEVDNRDAEQIMQNVVGLIPEPCGIYETQDVYSDFVVSKVGNELVFTAKGKFFGCKVTLADSKSFGNPIIVRGMMSAVNITSDTIIVALACAYSIDSVFMRIPIKSSLNISSIQANINGSEQTYAIQQATRIETIESNITIYPNPVRNLLTISGINEPTVATVCSVSGSIMQITELNSGSTEINVNNLANGVYILKLQTATNVVVKRFIKQ